MDNKLVSLLITITVAIILVATLVVPTISDAKESQKETYTNTGNRVSEINTNTIDYSYDVSTKTITIGTETISWSTQNAPLVVLACDNGFIKTNYAGTNCTLFTPTNAINPTSFDVSVDGSTKTVSISNVVASTTVDDFTFTYNDWCFVPSVTGNMIANVPNSNDKTVYIEDDSTIYSYFHSGATWTLGFKGDTEVTKTGSPTYTTNFESTPVEDLNGLNTMMIQATSTSQYTIDVGGTTTYADVVIVDRQASGTTDLDSSMSLLAVIPVLIIVAILVFAVRSLNYRD